MKLLMSCLAVAGIVGSVSAPAAAITAADLKLPYSKFTTMSKRSEPTKEPIRFAKYQALMVKLWQEKQADGTFVGKEEKVCELTGQVPVFEASENENFRYDQPYANCKVSLKNGLAEINMQNYIMFMKDYSDPFRPGTRIPLKIFGSFLWAVSGSGTRSVVAPGAFVGSEDLSTNNLTLVGTVNRLSDDSEADTQLSEQIRVLVKIED